jgi:hypothetical protein
MEHKSIKEWSHFILSREEKVALIESKIARAEAQVKALADMAKARASVRGSKYSSC